MSDRIVRRDTAKCLLALHRARRASDVFTAEVELASAKMLFMFGQVRMLSRVSQTFARAVDNLEKLKAA